MDQPTPIPSGDQPGSFDRAERWVLWILVALIVLGLCGLTGLAGWLIAPFTPFWANWLSVTQGRVEVIAPAEWDPGGGKMSPDGRYMVMGWKRDGQHEQFIWDLATHAKLSFEARTTNLCWLNPKYLALLDSTMNYYLVVVPDARLIPAIHIAKDQFSAARGDRRN